MIWQSKCLYRTVFAFCHGTKIGLLDMYTSYLVTLLVAVATNLVRLVIKFLKIFQTEVTNKVRLLIVAGC